ncbi:hypothetical protein NC981_03265 [Leptolyngbya sp. DQ-M1]|uniref:hypothetical protein n=1 Tax=Leptolyngbya sp. DQ-M1 TaxID=2933920 RepID=UPI003297C233
MNIKPLVIVLPTLISTLAVSPAIEAVSWTRINALPNTAQKIAACPNGMMYVLHREGRVLANRSSERGSGWQRINTDTPTDASAITNLLCAGNKLHLVKNSRVFRNDGTDAAPRWVYAGNFRDRTPSAAPFAVSGASIDAGRVSLSDYFALFASPDGTALTRSALTLQSQRRIGLPQSAIAIAGAGDSLARISRVFALNTDRTLWLNSGAGCDPAWRRIDRPVAAEQIAAKSVEQLYALNTDKTLWEGQLRRTVSTVGLGDREINSINAVALRGTRFTLDRKRGTNDMELRITPSRFLQNAGLNNSTQELGGVMVPGILGARHAVWISNLNSNDLQLRLTPDAIVLEMGFAPGGKITVDTAIRGNWDIRNAKLTLTLGINYDLCGLARLTLKSTRFDARLDGDVVGSFIGNFENVRERIEAAINTRVPEFLNQPEVAGALRGALVQMVPALPPSAFSTPRPTNPPHTLIGWTTGIRNGRFTYTVEGD